MKYVRVKDPDRGKVYSTTEDIAKATNLEIVDKEGADAYGKPLPPKDLTDLAGQPVKATTKKEG